MDMAQHTHYDVIIIGAGQSGGPLSTAFAQAGRKTALIEREHVGGTCINVGCTPTKTMIACWPLTGPDKFKQRIVIRAKPASVVSGGD